MKIFWKYFFPVLFGILVYASIRAVNDTTAGVRFWERPWITNATEIGSMIVISYLIQTLLNFFIRKFEKQGNKTITSEAILKEFLAVFLGILLLLHLTIVPIMALTDDGLQVNDYVIGMIIPLLYVLLYFAIARSNFYLKSLINQRLQLEKIANDHLQTELKFLKAQYHPHFLFNALNTIYFQMDGDVQAAKKSVEKFSELLRYQLYDQQQTVSLAQELRYLENYIELQKLRSSERLNLELHFDPQLKNQQVYPLLFLPLVENAFKYVGGEFQLIIRAIRKDGGMEFTVTNSIPRLPLPVKEGGIGLENLKRRLELLYPGRHALQVQKENDKFMVRLELPFLS